MAFAPCLALEVFAADLARDVLVAVEFVEMIGIVVLKVLIADLAVIMSGFERHFVLDEKRLRGKGHMTAGIWAGKS